MKASVILALLGVSFTVAAPALVNREAAAGSPTPPSYEPTAPQPYGPSHSVDHKAWKRHAEPEAGSEPPSYGGAPPNPYPSGATVHYERTVPDMEAPEHFEVLTA